MTETGQKILNSRWEEEEKISLAGGTCRLCVQALIQSHSSRLQQTFSLFLSPSPDSSKWSRKQANSSDVPADPLLSPVLCSLAAHQQHFPWLT